MEVYPGVRRMERIWSVWRPEGRKKGVCVIRLIVRGSRGGIAARGDGVLKRERGESVSKREDWGK